MIEMTLVITDYREWYMMPAVAVCQDNCTTDKVKQKKTKQHGSSNQDVKRYK